MVKEEKKNKNLNERPSVNGVRITIYVELPTIRSRQINDPFRKFKPAPFTKKTPTAKTKGYDRRAQLLAYARELRYGSPQELGRPRKNAKPKPKKWRWSPSLVKLRQSLPMLSQTKRRWKYKRLGSDETTEVKRSYGPGQFKRWKRKATGMSNSHFCRKLRKILKGLSCGWQCRRG